jgi:hypothetical protein
MLLKMDSVLPMLCSVDFPVEGPVAFSLPHDGRLPPSQARANVDSRCTCANFRMGVMTENSRHKNNLFLAGLVAPQHCKRWSE